MFTFEHIEEALASSYLRKQVPLRFSLFDWQKRFLLSAANEESAYPVAPGGGAVAVVGDVAIVLGGAPMRVEYGQRDDPVARVS